MNYFPKRKKPSKKGEYLQIYISEYIPGKGSRNRFHIALGYLSDMIARGIANPVSYAKKMVAELNDSKEKKAPQIEETSVLKNVGYFLLKAMIGSLSIDSDLAMMTSNRKFRYGFSYFLRAMIYTQVVDPGSKLMTSKRVIPNLYGCESFSYDQILDGITYIGSEYQKFIELFNRHIQDVYPRRTGNVFFNYTNYYFKIDAEDSLSRKDPSKENRKSKIVVQAFLLDVEKIPLGMTLFSGNEERSRSYPDISRTSRTDTVSKAGSSRWPTMASTAPGTSTLQSGRPMTDTYSRSRCTEKIYLPWRKNGLFSTTRTTYGWKSVTPAESWSISTRKAVERTAIPIPSRTTKG